LVLLNQQAPVDSSLINELLDAEVISHVDILAVRVLDLSFVIHSIDV